MVDLKLSDLISFLMDYFYYNAYFKALNFVIINLAITSDITF